MVKYLSINRKWVQIDEPTTESDIKQIVALRKMLRAQEWRDKKEHEADMKRICPHCGMIMPLSGHCPDCE